MQKTHLQEEKTARHKTQKPLLADTQKLQIIPHQ
jgi:hypothetical protein